MSYMSEYMLKRYYARRAEAFEVLGGICMQCGTSESLEIDHIDPSTKSFDLGTFWNCARVKFLMELKKCQLLCAKHHKIKSDLELSVGHGQGLTGRRNCYCDLCKPLKQEYNRTRRHLWRS